VDDLLLLIHRIPYPPNKGDKIRSYHLLKHLSQRYRVHLACFVDDRADWQHVPKVEAMCATSHFAALNPRMARVRSLGALLANRSLSLDYYRDAALARWVEAGYRLFFVSNQGGIASGHLTRPAAEAALGRTAELLRLPVAEVAYCPHAAYPVSCYCRKPMPGLGVCLMQRHRLAREHLIVVGDMASDAEFAAGLGARYFDAAAFFALNAPGV
jgi:HAD superfamily hydrolase (TIGR01662 family)